MTVRYEYSNGVMLRDPWRYTKQPIWADDSDSYRSWHRWVPAKIEFAGETGYFSGVVGDE